MLVLMFKALVAEAAVVQELRDFFNAGSFQDMLAGLEPSLDEAGAWHPQQLHCMGSEVLAGGTNQSQLLCYTARLRHGLMKIKTRHLMSLADQKWGICCLVLSAHDQ